MAKVVKEELTSEQKQAKTMHGNARARVEGDRWGTTK